MPALFVTTLRPLTGPTGSVYYPWDSTCNSEVIFNAGAALTSHRRQLSVATRDVYSSSSSSFVRLTCKAHYVQATKNPCFPGVSIFAASPHLADFSAGIGTFPATLQGGCRASSGRFPPPLWMRADITAHMKLSGCFSFVSKYTEELPFVSRGIDGMSRTTCPIPGLYADLLQCIIM
jgi:hypothetical protein